MVFRIWCQPRPRLGKQEGFQNISKAQCHCVGTAAMRKAGASVHENVEGYDDSHLTQNLHQEIMLSTLLDHILRCTYHIPNRVSRYIPHASTPLAPPCQG